MTFRITLDTIATNGENPHLSEVHTYGNTFTLIDLYAVTDVVWSNGDVAILPGSINQGTYIYRGTDQTTAGVTVAGDWHRLDSPTDTVRSVAGLISPQVEDPSLLRAALNVTDGAQATPANGIYLDPAAGTVGQIPKIDADGNWGFGSDDGELIEISTADAEAGQITLQLTGTGADAILTTASSSESGIVTSAQFASWEAKIENFSLTTETGRATIEAGNTTAAFPLSSWLAGEGAETETPTEIRAVLFGTPEAGVFYAYTIDGSTSSPATAQEIAAAGIVVGSVLELDNVADNRATVTEIADETDNVNIGAFVIKSGNTSDTQWDTTGIDSSPTNPTVVSIVTGGVADPISTIAPYNYLSYNGLVLEEGLDYSVVNPGLPTAQINLSAATVTATAVLGGTFILESTVVAQS